jgi:hypothetical protein
MNFYFDISDGGWGGIVLTQYGSPVDHWGGSENTHLVSSFTLAGILSGVMVSILA